VSPVNYSELLAFQRVLQPDFYLIRLVSIYPMHIITHAFPDLYICDDNPPASGIIAIAHQLDLILSRPGAVSP
jgi:hypothetical protein